ncbi:MAG TPA: DsbA family protein [Rhizomicrobium sp.]|nr:DsbA family protein [Rhizomicrobium sp.]
MRAFVITLAGAIGGAALAVAIIVTMARHGYMPINDRQMQTYLMQHPELALAMMGRHEAMEKEKEVAQREATLAKVGQAAFFDPRIAFVTGPADAKKTLVEFYDYDCPYCRASLPAMKKFYEAHKNDTRIALIEFPIEQLHGAGAIFASKASLAARRQPDRYLDFHFALMSEEGAMTEEMVFANAAKVGLDMAKLKADMADPEITKALNDSIALARKVGIDGTPTFIINGRMRPGAFMDDASISEEMAKS